MLAALARVPGAVWPIRPDEAGFTMVARAWDPGAGSVYGPYFVDRHPLLIGLVKLSDALGGPLFLRVVAAAGCAALVLATAALVREIAHLTGAPEPLAGRMVIWTAIGTTALTSNAMIDLVAAKGEILGLPVVVAAMWCSLRALSRRSHRWAFAAGLLGALALGLKQNLIGALAFAAVILAGDLIRRHLEPGEFLRLAVAGLSGAAIPVLGTVAWATLAGVRLETLWYAVFGMRSDALQVILSQPSHAPLVRAERLLAIFLLTGMALLFARFLIGLPRLFRAEPVLTTATAVVAAVDLAGVALGGSYWRPYLFALVPAAALAIALLTRHPGRPSAQPRRWVGRIVWATVASTVISTGGWMVVYASGLAPPTEYYTGTAIARVAHERDTMVVYGGRADLQFASGLSSPYPHLWSLPARTLDPGGQRLARLLRGPQRPTWFVEWVRADAWDPEVAENLRPVIAENYRPVDLACNGRPIFVRKGVSRPPIDLACDAAYRPWLNPRPAKRSIPGLCSVLLVDSALTCAPEPDGRPDRPR